MTTGNEPGSIAALVRARTLDAELGALLWMLVEARLPVIVAGEPGTARSSVQSALLQLLPVETHPVRLAGADEEFEWLPEATELGWLRERATGAKRAVALESSATAVLVADLDGGTPEGTWGPRARIAVRALALGYGMVATLRGGGLEDVMGVLKADPVSADDDELSRLGVVLAVGTPAQGPRITVAHYVRPIARDLHGHVQRMPPAVLAAWNPKTDRFEHFAWGVASELAARTGRRPIEFEREQARRAASLATWAEGSS